MKSTKYIDIKPEPKTELEAWLRWCNHMQTRLRSAMPNKKIEVKSDQGFTLNDFKSGDVYLDGDGCVISREEAQEEVDFLNGN